MADEIWDALYMHVERHRVLLDAGDGSGLMDKGLQPDLFDDVVKDEAMQAAAVEVEEVLDDERTKEPRMATSDMFRRKERA